MPSNGQTILVVDDEASVRRLLRRCFEAESYSVIEAENREQSLQAILERNVDLVTLDVSLAGEDGLSVARDIRELSTVPIIMLSGKGELIDKVLGLEVGADDYISKPFELREVLARVKSALRRAQINLKILDNRIAPAAKARQYLFGGCTLCTRTRDLRSAGGQVCELTTAEFDLLETFTRHPLQALSRDQIMDQMKGTDWNPNDRTIDNQVARLRKKLEIVGLSHVIKTVRGLGYQFTVKVTLI